MKARCYNTENISYKNYGGRGIKVCDRWLNNFSAFLQDMGPRPSGYSIERRDNDSDYCPENCYWADRKTQANNTRKNVYYQGKTISQWEQELGLSVGLVKSRLHKNWTWEQALGKVSPPKEARKYKGMTVSQWANYLGMPKSRIKNRLTHGWTWEQALGFEPSPRETSRKTYKGKSIMEWVEITGFTRKTIESRLKYGWSWEDAITKPVQR